MKLYFKKELGLERPIWINGAPVRFDVIALEESDAIAPHLLNAARKKVSGVVQLTSEQYEEELKKKASVRPPKRQREEVKQQALPYARSGSVRRVAVGDKSQVLQTPEQAAVSQDTESYKPSTEKGVL